MGTGHWPCRFVAAIRTGQWVEMMYVFLMYSFYGKLRVKASAKQDKATRKMCLRSRMWASPGRRMPFLPHATVLD